MSKSDSFTPLNLAVLTVSDTRTTETDTSGDTLENAALEAGHKVVARSIVKDDVYLLRAIVSAWVADPNIHSVVITGGTGFSSRDSTPEALLPLFDKEILGFGELFRQISYQEIGSSTIQSRAFAGIANFTAIFALPGSTGACKTGWEGIIKDQLNSQHGPCNYASLLLQKPNKDVSVVHSACASRG